MHLFYYLIMHLYLRSKYLNNYTRYFFVKYNRVYLILIE